MTRSETLPPALVNLRDSGSAEWDFQCDIVRAAYQFALSKGSDNAIKYMEEKMDLYGIERPIQ